MRIVLSFLLLFSLGVISVGQEPLAKPVYTLGGLIIVPPFIDYESVSLRADITELLAVLPEPSPELRGDVRFDKNVWARDIRVARDVWCLQFSFKPVRIIDADIPNTEGKFDRKKVWYLVYKVENLGQAEIGVDLRKTRTNSALGSVVPEERELNLPVPMDETSEGTPRSAPLELRQQTGVFEPQPGHVDSIRFVPHFVLASHRLVLGTVPIVNPETGETEWQAETTAIAYDERVIPLALPAIMRREGFDRIPETTVSIAQREIAPGQEVWGVAMWTGIDPRINEFSIFVSGLTNAYQWRDRPRSVCPETGKALSFENTGILGEGRIISRRVLKTDWWRVGDAYSLDESQIHFGSRDGNIPESVYVAQTADRRRMTPEERKQLDAAIEAAGMQLPDGVWVSPAASTIYHLMRQDWLKPSFGYEWIFL